MEANEVICLLVLWAKTMSKYNVSFDSLFSYDSNEKFDFMKFKGPKLFDFS